MSRREERKDGDVKKRKEEQKSKDADVKKRGEEQKRNYMSTGQKREEDQKQKPVKTSDIHKGSCPQFCSHSYAYNWIQCEKCNN